MLVNVNPVLVELLSIVPTNVMLLYVLILQHLVTTKENAMPIKQHAHVKLHMEELIVHLKCQVNTSSFSQIQSSEGPGHSCLPYSIFVHKRVRDGPVLKVVPLPIFSCCFIIDMWQKNSKNSDILLMYTLEP